MPPWPTRPESTEGESQSVYANVPTSPSPMTDPLSPGGADRALSPQQQSQPSTQRSSPLSSNVSRPSYISSPLNPNANSLGSRSRPGSWGGSAAMDKMAGVIDDGNSGGSSSSSDREAIRAIQSGAIGSQLGPYAVQPLQAQPVRSSTYSYAPPSFVAPTTHNRFSTLSSVGSVLSLSDSKYPSMYIPNSNTQLTGSFFPYSDSPHIDYATNQFTPDEDDAMHEPDPRGLREKRAPLNWRGVFNLAFVILIIVALVALFAGYPVASYFSAGQSWYTTAIGVNATGQAAAANLPGFPQLIDPETPDAAKSRVGYDGYTYDLVFSDEFNTDGRTFYEGDDPFWEAVDLNYWATGDLEWYDPSAVTTKGGALTITLEQVGEHGLNYRSGMLQGWNKLCFTGAYIEVAVLFPGNQLSKGFWPAAWTMGNLGRPGYGGTTDGMWPYTYDSCDVGTVANQTLNGVPALAQTSGRTGANGILSYLPGQRASACTCPGEPHPGPANNVGRGSPEIDIFEAERSKTGGPGGQTSQSSQYAPFAAAYAYPAGTTTVYTQGQTSMNTFFGSATQQSISALTNMDETWFQLATPNNYSVYGMEYMPDPQNRQAGFINWVAGGQRTWGLTGAAIGPDPSVNIGQRLISEEPMAMVLNLGLSESFQPIDMSTLSFPAVLSFDYVRIYQRRGQTNIGCDPKDYPTADYINKYMNAYTNVNYTSWAQAGYSFPKNSFALGGTC